MYNALLLALPRSQGRINPVPYMTGICEKEAAWRVNHYVPDGDRPSTLWKTFLALFDDVAPYTFGLYSKDTMPDSNAKQVMEKILRHYGINIEVRIDLSGRLAVIMIKMLWPV